MKLAFLSVCFIVTFAMKCFSASMFYEPEWSKDGAKMLLGADADTIEIFDSAGGKTGEIKTTGQLSGYSISPSGSRMFYFAKYEGLVVVDMHTGAKTVVHNGPCGQISWTPDGDSLLFSVIEFSANPGKRQKVTYMVNINDGGKREITRKTVEEMSTKELPMGTTVPAVNDTEAE